MTRSKNAHFQRIETNTYDFYRTRAQQERQRAMQNFFGYLFKVVK